MEKFKKFEDFKKALATAAEENPGSNFMWVVVREFDDVIDLLVAPGSTFDIIITSKNGDEVLYFNNHNPYFGYYWFDNKIPEDYYDDFGTIDIDKYGEECDFLAGYLLDNDDIDQVLVAQERFVKNPWFQLKKGVDDYKNKKL